ncbi:zinc-dependent metalloprotease [uncultured Microscilla sp.]|uniref:zinc-dependent metalloprotease n=1 Tax=uncultured Microscilla sp. TaxID=432653 RepID=UPI00260EA2BC|nr:zinc-dependent metalloprotease [uncultured Microscilla sp.]
MYKKLLLLSICICLSFGLWAQVQIGTPTIQQRTSGMKKIEGYFPLYWDKDNGGLWLEIDKFDQEILYVQSLAGGVGSNDIGLDRGQLGKSRIVKFRRVGNKVLMVQPNYKYRANTKNKAEKQAVELAFAQSVLWGFQIAAIEGNKVLVEATRFFLRDAHGVANRLKSKKQGYYRLDNTRSAFYLPRTKNFPKNTEVEVTLTFTGNAQGKYIRSVAPTPEAVTVRQHYSLVALPDNKYKPRQFDPRAGFGRLSYVDYASSLNDRIVKNMIPRHRLKKKNPQAKVSEPIKPIVYYIDPGVPEPIRSAMLEGGRWWNQAFEAAGYKNAFQVKVLPPDADPMDVRYNVVNWVHRSTRGWSYGATVKDPRTGEIIKGHVTLGSLRLRQDYLIAEGLLAPYANGTKIPEDMQKIALARLRQLVAHEIGHTLGLSHNFASSVNKRASVMDYPHPLVKVKGNGRIDWSDVYATNIGEWDKVAIKYGYSDFPPNTDEKKALNKILDDAIKQGLYYISDADARPMGGAHPLAHLWDNGTSAAEELDRIMKVRAKALANFSEKNIRMGEPMSHLEDVLVPVYLLHRYQVEAASKVVGGLYYTYALRGDQQQVTRIVPAKEQQKALKALLATLEPEALVLPEKTLKIIPPKAYGYARNHENFRAHTGVAFDPLAVAETAASITLKMLLHHERAARLVQYHARNAKNPGLQQVITQLLEVTLKSSIKQGYPGEVQKVVNNTVLYQLIQLANHPKAATQVKAIATYELQEMKEWLKNKQIAVKDKATKAHYFFAALEIEKFQKGIIKHKFTVPSMPPAGSPIGGGFSPSNACGFKE